mmetsp:Transcript_120129/g.236056  ORF Transcript_120129/g.236056 Transcript_120129/m.236056 type:complete len:201 (-) Transcript_120129:421-1023(-)
MRGSCAAQTSGSLCRRPRSSYTPLPRRSARVKARAGCRRIGRRTQRGSAASGATRGRGGSGTTARRSATIQGCPTRTRHPRSPCSAWSMDRCMIRSRSSSLPSFANRTRTTCQANAALMADPVAALASASSALILGAAFRRRIARLAARLSGAPMTPLNPPTTTTFSCERTLQSSCDDLGALPHRLPLWWGPRHWALQLF